MRNAFEVAVLPAGRCDLYDRPAVPRPAVPPPVVARPDLLIPAFLALLADNDDDGVPESTGGRNPVPAWVPDNRRPVYKTELCSFREVVRWGGAWAASHVGICPLAQPPVGWSVPSQTVPMEKVSHCT